MNGKFIIDCYNNAIDGWFHILPLNNPEAIPLLEQYEMAKRRHGNLFTNIFPYNNSWWCVVEAENVLDAMNIFRDIYKKEVYSKAFEEAGHWVEEIINIGSRKVFCSKCGCSAPFEYVSSGDVYSASGYGVINKTKFCPNCGKRMVEQQERSEVKE